VRIVRDVASPGRRAADAPGLQHACEALVRGEARALVVQNLARVTRSPARLAILLRWLADSDRGLIAIENGFDTSTFRRSAWSAAHWWKSVSGTANVPRSAVQQTAAEGAAVGAPQCATSPSCTRGSRRCERPASACTRSPTR
jgi:hypothetical protein